MLQNIFDLVEKISGIISNYAPTDLQPHCHYQIFSPLANGVYLIAIINKTSLCNGNCPIMNLITEMGVAHTMGPIGPTIVIKYSGHAM